MKKELLAFAMSALGFGALSADAATVYFLNEAGWESVYAYSWGPGEADPAWPGQNLTQTVTVGDKEYYSVELDTENLIFNNNSGKQTKDLKVKDGAVFSSASLENSYPIGTIEDGVFTPTGEIEIKYAKIYIPVSDYPGQNCNIYSWAPELFGGWPGKAMTKETVDNLSSGNSSSYWTIEVDENDITDKTIAGWKLNGGASDSSEVYGTIFQDGYVYHLDGTSHLLGEHSDEPVATNVYIANSLTSPKFTIGPSSKMTTEDGETYTYTLANATGDTEFKIVVGDAWLGNGEQDMSDGTYIIEGNINTNMTLENGGEEVVFTVKLLGGNKVELTISGQTPVEEDEFAPIYLMSSKIGNVAINENRLSTEDGKVYTITMENFSGDLPFHFYGKDTHKHNFSNGQQNMKNGKYDLTVTDVNAAYGEMTLDNGGTVTFTFTLSDDHTSATLDIQGQEEIVDEYPRMYLVGERTEWIATEAYRMQTTDGKTYTLEVEDMSTKPFRFTGETWTVRSVGNGGVKLADGEYDLEAGSVNMSLAKGGHVIFTLTSEDDFATAKLTVEGQGETPVSEFGKMYIVGTMTNWTDGEPIEMTTTDGLTYEVTVNGMTKNDEFKFFGGNWNKRKLSGAGGGLANGEHELSPCDPNMTLGIGGDVTFQLVFDEPVKEETLIIDKAKLIISGQVGEVETVITYALRGEFYNKDSWEDINLTQEEDSNVWSATFTPKYSGGSFGVKRMVNGIQPAIDGWYSASVTFNAETSSAELGGGANCVFEFPANEEIKVSFDTELKTLTFSGFTEQPIDPDDPEILTLYVIGTATEAGWNASDDYKLTSQDGKIYTVTCKLKGAQGFKIYPGNWDDPDHNYGSAGNDLEDGEYDIYANATTGDITLKYGGDNVTLTLDVENNKLTVSGQDSNIVIEKVVTYHLHGQWHGTTDTDWETVDMEKQADNTWTATFTPKATGGKFGVVMKENGTQTAWYKEDHAFNKENQKKVLSIDGADNCTHAYAANTPCTFTFNPDTRELSVVGDTSTGISAIDADSSEAIYFNLQGIRVENPESGLYIVVRNGQTSKEVVK